MLKSSLCDYSDGYILVKGTITVPYIAPTDANANNASKKIIFKNDAPFINCIFEINNTQADSSKDIDIVMSMYNLLEYSDNYSKKSSCLRQYFKDIIAVNNNDMIVEFNEGNATDSFNFKSKITGQTGANGRNNVEIMVQLKYLSSFWRTLEKPFVKLILF